MSHQIVSMIIIATWVVLLLFLLIGRNFVSRRFLDGAKNVCIPDVPNQENTPGSPWSKGGTLFVFIANIATIALVFAMAISPPMAQRLDWVSVELSPWVKILGSIFFILNAIWGLLALLFNPNYTPAFRPMKEKFLLAMRGPYAIVRHPRYASEAWLNVILFLFTGIWLPLLGVLGWVGMYDQACREEEILMMLAGEDYDKYRQHTGMFSPKLN